MGVMKQDRVARSVWNSIRFIALQCYILQSTGILHLLSVKIKGEMAEWFSPMDKSLSSG